MIHERTLICQLAPLVERVSKTVFEGTETGPDKRTFEYRATGYQTVNKGYTEFTGTPDKAELNDVSNGQECDVVDSNVNDLETKPKPRFTEATFLAELERLGIGRPSTFSSILSTLYFRHYVQLRNKTLAITPVGSSVYQALENTRFSKVEYTANMEELLDKVADGKSGYLDIVRPIYAESQRDAESIKPFTLPETPGSVRQAAPKRRPVGNNPNTKATGTKKRKVTSSSKTRSSQYGKTRTRPKY